MLLSSFAFSIPSSGLKITIFEPSAVTRVILYENSPSKLFNARRNFSPFSFIDPEIYQVSLIAFFSWNVSSVPRTFSKLSLFLLNISGILLNFSDFIISFPFFSFIIYNIIIFKKSEVFFMKLQISDFQETWNL